MSNGTTLGELARASGDVLTGVGGVPDTAITGLSYDSRAVRPGDLFFCIPGARTDGHRWAAEAVRSGAVALCVERPTGQKVPELVVTDARLALPRISAVFYGHPSAAMTVIGVTGTNGKTTTAYLVESILRASGRTTGLIGTVETRIAGESRPGVRTTPESRDVQALLAEMRDRGVQAAAMEVTSHGLVLHRVEAVKFAAAIFTNLTQDHLDFHAGMEDYFQAKRSLFVAGRTDVAILNFDDDWGRRLYREIDLPKISFGSSPDADVRAEEIHMSPHGSEFIGVTPDGRVKIRTSLAGAFNVSNCLAAIAACRVVGVSPEDLERGIGALSAVPGRFEGIDAGQPFSVIVDYAHTPDSLDNVLRTARRLAALHEGRVICAFGCGGDRDRAKRPLMGAVVARLADVVVVTSDNPRSEDPQAIISEILEGVVAERAEGPDLVEADRAAAIDASVDIARPGDVVVIAGKGHETGQQFADHTVEFDDREVARRALAHAGWESVA